MKFRLKTIPSKSIIIGAFICIASISFSQDNTLPTTGNIGVGTLTPSARLDVNGNAIIDSCLLIKDSLQVNKTIRTMGKMFVEQKMTMKGNAVVKQNFRVNGNSRIDGNQRTFGNSRVEGLLKLPNTTTLSDQLFNDGNFELLVLKPNGTTKKIDYDSLLQKMGNGMYGSDLDPGELCKYEATAPIPSPRWSNGVNKIYTSCPQVFVGIRTSTPAFPLDVIGRGAFTRGVKLGTYNATPGTSLIYAHQNFGVPTPFVHLEVNEGGIDKTVFLVNNDGGIYCTSARVRLKENIPVPDFVFKKNYQLMPLTEVKEYITENSHLPNIPSEKEIKKDGLSLDEMQMKLLQKVEELTLYVIALDEKNKELEAQLKALTK